MSTLPHSTPSDAGQRFEHDAMACTFGLCLFGVDRRYAEQVARAAFDEVDRLEQTLSRFVPHSDIVRLSALKAGQTIPVAVETIECLQLAAQLHDLTGGAFDAAFRTPGPRDVAPLVLDPAAHAVGVQVPGVQLDLGGLGKGYAVDRVVGLLREWGVPAGRVHAGQSTVRVFGTAAGDAMWRVGLRHPERPDETLGLVELYDAISPGSVVTGPEQREDSNSRRLQPSPNPSSPQRVARGDLEGRGVGASALSGSGQHLHGGHIVNPRRGEMAGAVQAAWAVAPSAALADGLSTAFMILSTGEIESVCRRLANVTAILLPAGPSPTLQVFGAPCGLDPGE
ncbi:MAG: FAD:protein FMN transferase [Planctomycetota bacterium]